MNANNLQALTDLQRECLRAYFETPNHKAVARKLNISVDAVKDRLTRARSTLGAFDSHTAAYALAVSEGRVIPLSEGLPPPEVVTVHATFPADRFLPNPEASVASMVRDHSSAPPRPTLGNTPRREKVYDSNSLKERFSSVSSQAVKAAQAIALIIVLAAIAMAAINSLQPGFFRFLDNLHS